MIKILNNYDVRMIYNCDEEWFNVSDIQTVLGIANIRQLLSNIPTKHKRKFKNSDVCETYNQNFSDALNNRGENFISAHGVYQIAFRSNKEEAREFTEWVSDVIELIRKNGYYIADEKCNEWLNIRKEVKEGRKDLTSVLKVLREYAINQGSVNYLEKEKAIYSNYSRMLNSRMGIQSSQRDLLSQSKLMDLKMYENIQKKIIIKGIEEERHYKDIYQDVKSFINMI